LRKGSRIGESFLLVEKETKTLKIKAALLAVLATILTVFAGGTQVFASEFSFSVTPIAAANQIDKSKSYFDLQLKPGQKETVYVQLRNDLAREVKVDVAVNHATTNSNVIVDYSTSTKTADASMKYDLAKIVQAPKQVTLKPHSVVKVPFQLQMPAATFNGVLAGGITFKEAKTTKTSQSSSGQGLAINNEYSYVVALLMRQNSTAVAPNMTLHTVKPDQINARNVISANLQNNQMTYINQVAIQAQVTKKGDSKVLYSANKTALQIAPNSNFNFPVALNGQALEPGTYHIKLIVDGNKSDNGKYARGKDSKGQSLRYQNEWVLEKDFTISAATAQDLNKKDVTIKTDYTWIYILVGIGLLLLVLLIIWLIWRKKQKDAKEAARKAE